MPHRIVIGTVGWSIPRASAVRCPTEGTHLQRYSRVFAATEINSSFHRPHATSTYAKWAALTPPDFRFAVKCPRTITHDHKLRRIRALFEPFVVECAGLGDRRGPLLVQLPPSLAFEPRVAARAFALMCGAFAGRVVCEPRHPSWFTSSADALLVRFEVARVAADPPPVAGADVPGGWRGLSYFRLHGSPRTYWSTYDSLYLARLADRVRDAAFTHDVWCVFDNTASGAAIENAWELSQRLAEAS